MALNGQNRQFLQPCIQTYLEKKLILYLPLMLQNLLVDPVQTSWSYPVFIGCAKDWQVFQAQSNSSDLREQSCS